MPIEWDEIQDRWNNCVPVKGVAFLANDGALVRDKSGQLRTATVVALRAIHSEPEYEIHLEDGERLVLPQSELMSPIPENIEDYMAWIQKWYASQCDDDWEHQYGLEIDTLDNPGWSVYIDLEGTDLVDKVFNPIELEEPKRTWLLCKVAKHRFEGMGGPHMLGEILGTFVRWAREQSRFG